MSESIFTKKTTDGWIARNINARISIPISKILARYDIHPNWITLMNFPFVLLMFYFIAAPSYKAGAISGILFQWCSIFDGCDGEVARACNKVSQLGGWLDTFMDNLCYILFIIGLALWHTDNNSENSLSMIIAAAFVIVALSLTYIGMWKMGTSCHKEYRMAFRKNARKYLCLDELSRRENFSIIVMMILLFGQRQFLYHIVLFFSYAYASVVIITFPIIYSKVKKKSEIV